MDEKDTACCTKKKYQAKGKHDVTDSVNTCSCLEPACIATFKTIEEAGEHMDTDHHILTPEKEIKCRTTYVGSGQL